VADGALSSLYNQDISAWDGSNCSFSSYTYSRGTKSGTWGETSSDSTCNQVRGESLCTTTNGTVAQRGTPSMSDNSDSDVYCWCRMTAPRVGAWVFGNVYDSASPCSSGCAIRCADFVRLGTVFRAAVLGP
jgi:hypothetical protein